MNKIRSIVLGGAEEYLTKCDKYQDLFLEYNSKKWQRGSGDAVFSYSGGCEEKSSLSFIECKDCGISARFNSRIGDAIREEEYYSVGAVDKMNLIKDVGDDQFVPVGSFVSPEQAWMAVEDFFEKPMVKPSRIEWIDSEKIDWGDLW